MLNLGSVALMVDCSNPAHGMQWRSGVAKASESGQHHHMVWRTPARAPHNTYATDVYGAHPLRGHQALPFQGHRLSQRRLETSPRAVRVSVPSSSQSHILLCCVVCHTEPHNSNDRYIFETPTYLPTTADTIRRISMIDGCVHRLEVQVGASLLLLLLFPCSAHTASTPWGVPSGVQRVCKCAASSVPTDISDQSLNDATDESYVLRVDAPVSFIQARTVFGALHALETFSQMVDRVNYKDLPAADRRRVLPFFHGLQQQDAAAEDHAAASTEVGTVESGKEGVRHDGEVAGIARRLHATQDAGWWCTM